GKNAFWRTWRDALTKPGWFHLMLKASATKVLPDHELTEAREQMGEDRYAQEYECSFETAIRGAFYAEEMRRAAAEGRIGRVPVDRSVPVHTARGLEALREYRREWDDRLKDWKASPLHDWSSHAA